MGRRAWLWAVLAVVAAGILWVRIARHRGTVSPETGPIPDRGVTSPLNVPGGGPAPAEAYTVYSALYREPEQEPLAFAEDSVTDIPQLNGSCLKPSTQEEREMEDAFVTANQQSHRWEAKFTIAADYRMLSRAAAAEAQSCMETRFADAARCGSFRKLMHVRFLGVPGFNRSHTRALVSIVRMCGNDCGSGGIFEVEKAGGTWRRAEPGEFTENCSWMYEK